MAESTASGVDDGPSIDDGPSTHKHCATDPTAAMADTVGDSTSPLVAAPSTPLTVPIVEVFTTMRYEARAGGISVQEMIAPLLDAVHTMRAAKTAISPLSLPISGKGTKVPLLARHIDRLRGAVAAMTSAYPEAWARTTFDEDAVLAQIHDHLAGLEDKGEGLARRVRVAIHAQDSDSGGGSHGPVTVTSAPMSATPAHCTVRLDPRPLPPMRSLALDDAMALRHKTARRDVYDEARARVGATLGMAAAMGAKTAGPSSCFDVLMCAGSAEHASHSGTLPPALAPRIVLTEASIANILVAVREEDGNIRVYTPATVGDKGSDATCAGGAPPLLLPGVLRQELLALGLASPATLDAMHIRSLVVDQQRAQLFLCNALRGIVPVDWVE